MMLRVIAVGFAFALNSATAAEPTLADKLKPFIDGHKGTIAIAVKNLESGDTFAHKANDVMPTASLIKMAIMVEAYCQAEEKKIDLTKTLTVTKDDKVQGSGILTEHFSDGVTLPLRDAIRLMIVYSDNTATNLVLDQVGMKSVNERMNSLGFKETRINAKVFKPKTRISQERGEKYGLGSTTANDCIGLLELLHTGKVATPDVCKTMLGHLKACDDHEKLTRFLPAGTVVAHKTGSVNASRTDAGIIYIPDTSDKKKTLPVAVCVLTNENKDQSWVADNAAQVTIANIGKVVYEHYKAKN
ncbi:serine hydrolase [soil metagenome]